MTIIIEDAGAELGGEANLILPDVKEMPEGDIRLRIKNPTTGRFLSSQGKWTPAPEDLYPDSVAFDPNKGLILRLGPELTTPMPLHTWMEIEILPLGITERVMWEGVLPYMGDLNNLYKGKKSGAPPRRSRPESEKPAATDSQNAAADNAKAPDADSSSNESDALIPLDDGDGASPSSDEEEAADDERSKEEVDDKAPTDADIGSKDADAPGASTADDKAPQPADAAAASDGDAKRSCWSRLGLAVAGIALVAFLAGAGGGWIFGKNSGNKERIAQLEAELTQKKTALATAEKHIQTLRRQAYGRLPRVLDVPPVSPAGLRPEIVIAANPAEAALVLASKAEESERPEERFYWLAQAAKRGHAGALLAVADMLARGQGVPKDTKTAFQLARLADLLGAEDASRYLVALIEGEHVPHGKVAEILAGYETSAGYDGEAGGQRR